MSPSEELQPSEDDTELLGLTGKILCLLERINLIPWHAVTVSNAARVVDQGIVSHRLECLSDIGQQHLLDAVELVSSSVSPSVMGSWRKDKEEKGCLRRVS